MHTILLVDDDEEFLKSFKAMIEIEYRVLTALSVSEAVGILSVESVATVVTDYKMTGGSGLDLAKFVQALSSRPPVIMVSAFIDKEIACQCVNSGVFRIIEKPFSAQDVHEKLAEAVSATLGACKHLDGEFQIQMSPHTLEIHLNSRVIKLTATEFGIFVILYSNREQWVSRRYLEEKVFQERAISRNLFDTHFSNLRRKIPEMKDHITALRGRGYIFKNRLDQ